MQARRKQLDDHPLVLCFDILQQMGKPGEYVWKNGEKIANVQERVAYLKDAILWLRAKLKENNRIPYRELPVDFRTFCESDELMKKRGVLWPEVIKAGADLNSGRYVEAVLTGGIGCAKTTLAIYTMAYQLYVLACLLMEDVKDDKPDENGQRPVWAANEARWRHAAKKLLSRAMITGLYTKADLQMIA